MVIARRFLKLISLGVKSGNTSYGHGAYGHGPYGH